MPAQLAVLEALNAVAVPQTVIAGEVLFHEGDPADGLYIVEDGCLVVSRKRHDGLTIELHRLRRGDLAGVTSLYTEQPRSATLTASKHPSLARSGAGLA